MADKGQHEVFNFDTHGSLFEFALEKKGSIVGLRFTRKRLDKPDDSLLLWVSSQGLDEIREAVSPALAVLDRYQFDKGEFGIEVTGGSRSTLLNFTNRVEGEVSCGEHPDQVLIWIPTASVEDVKLALSKPGSA